MNYPDNHEPPFYFQYDRSPSIAFGPWSSLCFSLLSFSLSPSPARRQVPIKKRKKRTKRTRRKKRLRASTIDQQPLNCILIMAMPVPQINETRSTLATYDTPSFVFPFLPYYTSRHHLLHSFIPLFTTFPFFLITSNIPLHHLPFIFIVRLNITLFLTPVHRHSTLALATRLSG